MSTQAPAQLFDGSEREAWSQTPQPKTLAAPDETPDAQAFDPDAEEWNDFDWDAYNKRLAKRLPSLDKSESDWQSKVGAQGWSARRLPTPIVRWLIADVPNKSLWEWLGADELKATKHEILRGFQQSPTSLRREPVQKRLAVWLSKHPEEIHLLLLRWGAREPGAPILEALREQPDEALLRERLPSLIRTFGPGAVGTAVAFEGVTRLLGPLLEMVMDDEKLIQIMQTAPLYGAQEAAPEPQESPAPDSQAARFWQGEACKIGEELDAMRAQLAEARAQLERGANAGVRIKTLESEVANWKKRELQKAAQAEKKLGQLERKWAAKYAELEKLGTREERRARALQSQIDELELDNKRQKKQLRQSAQSREEERKKVIALEARLSQLNGDKKAESAPKQVDAVSSPPTTQTAPNQVVKVSKPSPLDEIFEWRAHGRRVRLTAREVRRLIDKNDEESVGNVMLELEALQDSNPELRQRFLARLGQAGAHYPRVLTHRTSRVLVDASNVARYLPNRYGKGQLEHLYLLRDELQRLDCWPIIMVADASLPYNIDEPGELREMARLGEITITDKGVEADEILAREARATGAYVVTNDAKFFYKVSPDYEPPRITFRVMDGLVVVDEF